MARGPCDVGFPPGPSVAQAVGTQASSHIIYATNIDRQTADTTHFQADVAVDGTDIFKRPFVCYQNRFLRSQKPSRRFAPFLSLLPFFLSLFTFFLCFLFFFVSLSFLSTFLLSSCQQS